MIDHVLNDASILERFRPLLRAHARYQLRGRMKQKLDDEDLVQQTLMDAYQSRHQFRGRSEDEVFGWLRTILYHNLIDTIHRFQTAKRDVRREVSLCREVRGPNLRSNLWLADDDRTPDQSAVQREQIALLRNAITQLPGQQRQAIEQFYLQDNSLKEVSAEMNCSVEAVSASLFRGLRQLRSILVADGDRASIPRRSVPDHPDHSN